MFANRLKYLRECQEISQKELSERLGVTAGAIGMYESGKRIPDAIMLKKIANYFNVSVDYLIGNDEVVKEHRAKELKDDVIEMLIRRGIVKNAKEINESHLKLIELAIDTYPKG